MPQKTNLNVAPYYDDFDARKNYYKILFRPGYSIQTRELTSLQSILQNQVESYGRFQFKQGELVIPGEVGFNNKLDYVKLSSVSEVAVTEESGNIVYKKYDIKELVGTQLQGLTSGVIAVVLEAAYSTTTDSDTLFVKYLNSGDSNNESTFRQGETLEVVGGINTPLLVVGTDGSVLPTSITITNQTTGETSSRTSPAMGFCSAVQVQEGVYFVNGYFVRNDENLLIIDKYYDKPSAKIGFVINEDVVTPEEDISLYDNARGYSNESSPGAHRLKITLSLQKYGYNDPTDKNFIQLLQIRDGEIEKQIKPADYSLLEETLARRTYDESGDYVVNNFPINVREYYQKNSNDGIYSLDFNTNTVNGLIPSEASKKMILSVAPGKAYVRGYEIVNKETKYLPIDKARETITRDNVTIKYKGLSQLKLTNVYGSVPLNTVGDELTAYPTIYLSSIFNDGSIGLNGLEPSGSPKRTVSRRSEKLSLSQGIKTIYVQVSGQLPTTDSDYPDKLWYVKSRSNNIPSVVDYVDVIAHSLVKRTEVSSSSSQYFLELTVIGKKQDLETKFLEYDSSEDSKYRFVYLEESYVYSDQVVTLSSTPSTSPVVNEDVSFKRGSSTITARVSFWDNQTKELGLKFTTSTQLVPTDFYVDGEDEIALSAASAVSYYGFVVDYNEVQTPIIGLAKPKDFSLLGRPSGFNEDTDVVISRGRTGSGITPYSATFNFSYFNPNFFTRILLEAAPLQGFAKGKYITGKTSGAYGVIENDSTGNYTVGNKLYITTLSGQFVSGETIVDEAGNSAKIATENTISHFIVNDGGTVTSGSKLVINGNTIDLSTVQVNILPGTGRIYSTVVVSREKLAEVYSSPPSIGVTPTPSSAANNPSITPVLFKNVVLTYNPQNIKSVWSEYNSYKFTGDVDLTKTDYSNYYQISSFTFNGFAGQKYIECNGFGANLSKDLIQGDIVQFTNKDNEVVKSVVQYVSDPEGVTKSRIYLDCSLQKDVVNASVLRLRPLVDNSSASLVFPTGSTQVKSLVNDSSDTKFKYYVRKDFTTDLTSGGGTITFTAQLPIGTQRFVTYSENNYIFTVLDKGSSSVVNNGDIVYIDERYVSITPPSESSGEITAGSFKIEGLPSNYFGTIPSGGTFPKLKLTATIEISKAKPRLKTSVENKRIIIIPSGDKVIPLRGQDYDTESLSIYSYSDIYKFRYVYEGTSTNPPEVDFTGNLVSGTDVTYKFTFDDGQRDTFYDVGRLVLKPGFDAPTGQLVVAFDYFEHSQGDFCSVDSYLHEAGVSADLIPSFNSAVHGVVSLKDVVDFRPKVDSTTTITGFQDISIVSPSGGASYVNFVGEGGVSSLTPAADSNLEYTVSFSETQYLDRIDALFLTKKGEFIVREGNSSLNPSKPEMIDDAIALAYIHIPSYTNSSKDVRILSVDNKRYTMRDIGKLEKRIERLEYYTTLSILEQQALNMQVKDEIGLDRFKSGFIVDNFEEHRIGNLQSIDYKCAIDTQQSVLRPQSKEDNFVLKELNVREDQRSISGYTNTNNIITLPYKSVKLLGNDYATVDKEGNESLINPNPFVVLQYVGDCNITPTIDQWYDTSTAPLVLDTNTKLYSIFLAKDEVKESLSSFYNSFIVNWVGSSSSFYNIGSLSNINSEDVKSSVTSASVSSSSNISPQNNELAKGVSGTTVNNNKISSSLQFYSRSIPIKFVVRRMKPKTNIYVFIDKINVNRWIAPDSIFTGIAGNSLSVFNSPLITDENGNLSGILLLPAGKPPAENSRWTGDVNTVSYDNSAPDVKLPTGSKTIRFTSSSKDDVKDSVDTYTEVNFYSTGILPENPSSIISTSAAYFKSNEGVQEVNSNTDVKIKPNPLAQTFKVENFDGGLFVTDVDLFFAKKSSSIPIRVYLTNIDSGKPGKYIIPGSECTLLPETKLKVYVTGDTETIVIKKDELVTGSKSGAIGPVFKVYDKNNIRVGDDASLEFELNKEQVYTLVLSNHNGKVFVQNEALTIPSVTTYNNKNNKSVSIVIAKNSGKVVDLKVTSVGDKYESASIIIESPQLPGGSTATASVDVSESKVYNATLALSGKGYTEAPSVSIRGVGSGAGGAVIESVIDIDTPAVVMGVAVDDGTNKKSTTPTKFTFQYPIYLQNNVEYALTIETDSTEYSIWSSKLGETDVATGTTVTSQPQLGSVYKSQNTDNWTEDLFEDIKFNLYRAQFDIKRSAELILVNNNLGYEKLADSPFETSVRSPSNATSSLFKGNNYIIKVNHRDHGFEDSGKSYVFFRNSEDVGGVSSVYLNSLLFKISNSGIDTYNIVSPNKAGSSIIGGGSNVLVSYNRKYEKLYAQLSYLQLTNTKIESFVKTTNIIPVDSNTQNYTSYSQSDYEKTFINEEHYFNNQKVVASRINETLNNIDNSLEYKFVLSSEKDYLSPVIDLNIASVKTITNRVENSTGKENRYGRRNQILKFLPLYNITLSVVGNASLIETNYTLVGKTSKAEGVIIEIDESVYLIRLKTKSTFQQGEEVNVVTTSGTTLTSLNVQATLISEVTYSFSENSNIVAYYPSNVNIDYDNKVNGKAILWDSKDKELIIENCYTPINNDYTSKITSNSAFSRKATNAAQAQDIFRVGDVLKTSDGRYVEVSSLDYTDGIDYVPETNSKNSSSVAKYVTKEVSINNPGTSIDVRTTVNVNDIENIKVLYKIKPVSSQSNFDDINWSLFNGDGSPDVKEIAIASNSTSGNFEKQSDYQELKFSVSNTEEFSSFAIKIILKSDNPAYSPKVQDFRAVASY